MSYESYATLKLPNFFFSNLSLLRGEMIDLDIEMLNNTKNCEASLELRGGDEHPLILLRVAITSGGSTNFSEHWESPGVSTKNLQ